MKVLIPIPPSVIQNGFSGMEELPGWAVAFIFGFFIAAIGYAAYKMWE